MISWNNIEKTGLPDEKPPRPFIVYSEKKGVLLAMLHWERWCELPGMADIEDKVTHYSEINLPKTSKVISPDEIKKKIPEEVIQVFNDLITEDFDGHSATILQKDAAIRVAKALKVTKNVIYKNHWLDIEDIFRENGWEVDYDKPGYNESYEPTFTFRKKK